jgi:hypothetical protein
MVVNLALLGAGGVTPVLVTTRPLETEAPVPRHQLSWQLEVRQAR